MEKQLSRKVEKNRGQRSTENSKKVEPPKLILPKSSIDFLEKMDKFLNINPYLAQNRFGCELSSDENKNADKKEAKKGYSSLLAELVKKRGKKDTDFCDRQLTELMELLNSRNLRIIKNFPCYQEYPFIPYDKLILGDGTGAYLKAQPLRLHPLYGVPFIPASVIKGTLRNAWITERYDGDEEKAESNEDFVDLFGGTGSERDAREGKLKFLDIFPNNFEIGLDVQTVHYKDYYSTHTVQPTDDQMTMPVYFMCLRNTKFIIYISCRDKAVWQRCKSEIDSMMEKVYKQYGIGAKTALGYGIIG